MSERPVEPKSYGDAAGADRVSASGPPPSANQMKSEPDPGDVVRDDEEATTALLAAAPPPEGPQSARVAHVVPGHPDGEVDTTR